MSGRTLQQFALVALLAVSLTAQAAAQTPPEVAPMPRPAQQHGELAIELGIGGPNVLFFNYELTLDGQPAMAPMPREKKADASEEEFGIEFGFQPPSPNYGPPVLSERNFDVTPTVPQMPIPVPPCCDADKCLLPTGSAQSQADNRQLFNFSVGLFGAPDGISVPFSVGLPRRNLPETSQHPMVVLSTFRCDNNGGWWVEVVRIPQPRPTHINFPSCCNAAPVQVVEARQIAEPQPACCAKAGKLSGTWVREMETVVVAATFIGDEMKISFSQTDGATTVSLIVTAEYAVTKEGLVHGVITGVDSEVKHSTKAEHPSQLTSEFPDGALALMLQEIVDSPFSFRIKSTSAGIMVSKLKIAGVEGLDAKGFAILGGMFKPCKEGCIPAPKAPKSAQDGAVSGMTLPSGRYLEHYPQYFSPDAQSPLPRELASQDVPRTVCPMPAPVPQTQAVPTMPVPVPPSCGLPPLPPPQQGWNPAQPANVPPTEFGMMVDVFGQMFCPGQRCPTPATPCPTPVQPAGAFFPQAGSSPPQPSAQLIPPAGLPPAPPSVAIPATQIPMAAKPALVGTWCREFGPRLCVVKFAPDHMILTATESHEVEDGKIEKVSWVFTIDYHLTRDGTTLVGLVTGVDLEMDGILDEDKYSRHEEDLADMHKLLVDKPIAMSVRVYGDTVMIGNIRTCGDKDDSALPLFAGRYKNVGDKPLPKPKPMKTTNAESSTLPPPVASYSTQGYPTTSGAETLPSSSPPSSAYPPSPPRPNPPLPPAADDRNPASWGTTSPVTPIMMPPTPPAVESKAKNDSRVPIAQPIRKGVPLPICEDPPSDEEILRAMRREAPGIPGICEVLHDDIVIVKNRLVDKIEPPRFFALIGPAQLHHCHWECIVHYTESIKLECPFPMCVRKPRAEVIYFDKDYLHLYVGPNGDMQKPIQQDLIKY
jgi:hypothetical protein